MITKKLSFLFSLFIISSLWAAENLIFEVEAPPGPVSVEQELTYNISLSVIDPLNNTKLVYVVPPNVLPLSAQASQGKCEVGKVINCALGSLTDPAVVTIVVKPTQVGMMSSDFMVEGITPEGQVVSKTQSVPITVGEATSTPQPKAPPPVLSMTVATVPSPVIIMNQLTYYIKVFSIPVSAKVKDVVLTYGLPVDFALISATASQGQCETNGVVECSLGTLTQAATVTITVVPTLLGTSGGKFNVTGVATDGQVVTTTESAEVVVNKPAPVQVSFSEATYSVDESQKIVTITVTRSGDSDRPIMVDYATQEGSAHQGQDYQPAQGTLHWLKGDTGPKTFDIQIIDDFEKEEDETLTLVLSHVLDATIDQGRSELIIKDHKVTGEVGFNPPTYVTNEASGTVTVKVSRTAGQDGYLSVNYATRDGTAIAGNDYQASVGTLTWQPGESGDKEIPITLFNDHQPEWEESFEVVLSQPTNQASLSKEREVATITLQDDKKQYDAIKLLTDVATTPSQRAMANTLGQLCQTGEAGQDLQQRCTEMLVHVGTSPQDVTTALQEIAPEEFAVQGRLSTETAARQGRNLYSRLMTLRSGSVNAMDFSQVGIDIEGQSVPLPSSDEEYRIHAKPLSSPKEEQLSSATAHQLNLYKFGVFVNGNISLGERTTTANESGFDFNTIGLTAGIDYRFTDTFILGVALGYNQAKADLSEENGEISSKGLNLSLYGTLYQANAWYVDMFYSLGALSYDNTRHLRYQLGPTLVDQMADSSHDAQQQLLSISAGHHFNFFGPIFTFTPTVRVDRMDSSIDSFQEGMSLPNAPGSGLALAIGDQSVNSFTLALGAQLSLNLVQSNGMILIPQLHWEWINESKNGQRQIQGYFIEDKSKTKFTLLTDEPDTRYANLGLGLAVQMNQSMAAFINYETLLGLQNTSIRSIMAGIRLEF